MALAEVGREEDQVPAWGVTGVGDLAAAALVGRDLGLTGVVALLALAGGGDTGAGAGLVLTALPMALAATVLSDPRRTTTVTSWASTGMTGSTDGSGAGTSSFRSPSSFRLGSASSSAKLGQGNC